MNEAEKRVFFAQKANKPNTIKMGGKKVALANFPIEQQEEIKKRLSERDPVLKQVLETQKFGIKIDGQEVGADNIHEFEIEPSKKEIKKPVVEEESIVIEEESAIPIVEKYTEKELKDLNKKQQTEILRELGIEKIPRLEKDRIKKILEFIK